MCLVRVLVVFGDNLSGLCFEGIEFVERRYEMVVCFLVNVVFS